MLTPALLPSPPTIGEMIDSSVALLEAERPAYVIRRSREDVRREVAVAVIRQLRTAEWSEREGSPDAA